MLCVGTDFGCVRLWRDWETASPSLSTGWALLPELLPQGSPGSRPSWGLQVAWSQAASRLVGGGDARTIKVWDVTAELRLADLPTNTESFVTGLEMTG